MKRFLLTLAIVLLPLTAMRAAEAPIPPSPSRWATDTVGFVSPQTLQAIDAQLEAFERATGSQVLVWIGDTTGDTPLEDWTVKAFERWKVGRMGLDDGLVLFVFATDRKARIEVGYGLEGKVPDAIASRILNDDVLPRIRAGDRDGAILAGVSALRGAISGEAGSGQSAVGATGETGTPNNPGERPTSRPPSAFELVIAGLLVLGFLVLLVTNPSLALYLLFTILSGGRGGGGGGGGGGFSGGGGRSGGGGASGSW